MASNEDKAPGSRAAGWRIVHDFAGLLAERVGRFAVGLMITGLVARHLGAAAFGELNYGLAIGLVGASIAQLGLDALVMRDIAARPDAAAETLTTALVLRGVAAMILWVGLAVAVLGVGHDPHEAVILMVLSLTALSAVTGLPALWFQAKTLGRWPAWAGLGVFAVAGLVRLLLVRGGAGLMSFAWVAVGEILVTGVITGLMVRRNARPGASWRFSRKIAMALAREAWPLWISGLATTVYMRFDQVILNALAGAQQVGLYAAGLRLSEQGYLIPMMLGPPMLGVLAAQATGSEARARLIERYFAASALAAYGFAACVWLLAPFVYGRLFGPEFGGAAAVARVQALGAPFAFLGVARSQVLVVAGLVRFTMWSTLAGALLNVGANLLLAPHFGAVGAAWSSVLAQAVAAWASTWAHPTTRPLAWAQTRALLSPWRAFTGNGG